MRTSWLRRMTDGYTMTQMKKTYHQGWLPPLSAAEIRLPHVGLVHPQLAEVRLPYVGLVPPPELRHHIGAGVAASMALALLLQIPRCHRVLTTTGSKKMRIVASSHPSSPPFVQHDTHSYLACLLQTPSTERQ